MTLGIGETLRAARQQQRLTLSDAAEETKIRETYLAALEEEEFAALGGDVYVRGFLRNYAKYLQLDPDPLVEVFRREYQASEEQPTLAASTQPALPGPPAGPSRAVVIGGSLLLLVVVLFLLGRGGDDADPDEVVLESGPAPAATTEVDGSTGGSASPQDTGSPEASDSPSEEPSETPSGLSEIEVAVEVFDGESYLRATVDGETELDNVEGQGETFDYTADEEFELRVGNASAVRVEVNGRDLGTLGEPGDVVEITCAIGENCRVTPVEISG